MPWPGAPKSQRTPPINPPSMRFPNSLNENSTMGDVAKAMKTAFDGLTVHEQAFANLPSQIATQASASATAAVESIQSESVSSVRAFNAATGSIIYFPGMGTVNDQLGEVAYRTQTSDAGAKIIVGDSSPVIVTLNASVTLPWFTVIVNDSSANVTLVPDSGAGYHGASGNILYPGGFAIIFFDGTTFYA